MKFKTNILHTNTNYIKKNNEIYIKKEIINTN